MTQQVTTLVQFKTCDFGADYAAATLAYDTDPDKAWIAPFTTAQRAYWAQQEGGLINGYAEEISARRSESINSIAQSAYNTCLSGGATVGSATPTNAEVTKALSDLETANQAATAATEALTKATADAAAASQAYAVNPNPVNANYVSWTQAALISAQAVSAQASAEVAAKTAVHDLAVEEAAQPHFSLALQTQLLNNNSTAAIPSASGLSAQVTVPFSTATLSKAPLDWKAFYRLDVTYIGFTYPNNWLLSFQGSDPYSAPVLTELTMRDSVRVQAHNLVSIAADIIQYIDAPAGETLSVPDELSARFYPIQSYFSFDIYRLVYLPDGQVIQDGVDFNDGVSQGALGDFSQSIYFPPLDATCDVSGLVEVYHLINGYFFGALYRLSNKLQQRKVDGVIYDYEVDAWQSGSNVLNHGDVELPGYVNIHESFQYQATLKLGIIRIKYKQQGVFRYQRMFLVWDGAPFSQESLAGMTSNATGTKFYGKHLTETSTMSESITLSGGTALHAPNGTYDVPVIEDIVVSNFESGTLTISPAVSAYVDYSQSIIKIRDVLKPLSVYAPYGPFVTEQPGYQSSGNFLSVLPNFVDYIDFKAMLSIVRVRAYTHANVFQYQRLFLVWSAGVTPPADRLLVSLGTNFNAEFTGFSDDSVIPVTISSSQYPGLSAQVNIESIEDVMIIGVSSTAVRGLLEQDAPALIVTPTSTHITCSSSIITAHATLKPNIFSALSTVPDFSLHRYQAWREDGYQYTQEDANELIRLNPGLAHGWRNSWSPPWRNNGRVDDYEESLAFANAFAAGFGGVLPPLGDGSYTWSFVDGWLLLGLYFKEGGPYASNYAWGSSTYFPYSGIWKGM